MLVMTIQTIIYIAVYRPFESKLNTITVTVTEIAIGLVFFLVIAFNFNTSADTSQIISTIVSVCIYIAVGFPVTVALVTMFLQLRRVLTHYIKAKVGPVSSDYNTHLGNSVVEFNKASGRAERPMAVYKEAISTKPSH